MSMQGRDGKIANDFARYARIATRGDETWKASAACREMNPELFFTPSQEQAAKAVCARCPVRTECLEYGMSTQTTSNRDGVWGGLNEEEMRKLHRRRVRAGTAAGSRGRKEGSQASGG